MDDPKSRGKSGIALLSKPRDRLPESVATMENIETDRSRSKLTFEFYLRLGGLTDTQESITCAFDPCCSVSSACSPLLETLLGLSINLLPYRGPRVPQRSVERCRSIFHHARQISGGCHEKASQYDDPFERSQAPGAFATTKHDCWTHNITHGLSNIGAFDKKRNNTHV